MHIEAKAIYIFIIISSTYLSKGNSLDSESTVGVSSKVTTTLTDYATNITNDSDVDNELRRIQEKASLIVFVAFLPGLLFAYVCCRYVPDKILDWVEK